MSELHKRSESAHSPRPWIRLYTDLPSNPKAQRLPGPLFKFWINCLCLYGKRGYFPPAPDIAWALQLSEQATIKNLRSLINAHLLDESPQDAGFEGILVDAIHPHDWDEMQFESDSSTERVKRFRERRMKPRRNVTVTPQEQSRADTEQIQSRAEPLMTPPLDEQFQEYRRLFEIVGNPIPEDFANGSFCWRAWCGLDYNQRSAAVDSLRERQRVGEAVLHNPDTYLTKGGYKRGIRKVSNGRSSGLSVDELAAL